MMLGSCFLAVKGGLFCSGADAFVARVKNSSATADCYIITITAETRALGRKNSSDAQKHDASEAER